MNNNWREVEITNELTDMILSGLLSHGTRQWIKGNLRVLYSPKEIHSDGLWKHLSISLNHRYPTWDEILDARYKFFDENDDVVQILPPKNEYVNLHNNCFHLWSPIGRRITPI